MFPKMNERAMKQAMKKMGIHPVEIDAEEVIIKCKDKELVIRDPQVSKINMMGQETIQVLGSIEEREAKSFNEEDVKTVMEQGDCSEREAIGVLEKNNGDLAKSILDLQSSK